MLETARRVITLHRADMPTLPPEIRSRNFDQVETGFSEKDAQSEARRCLQDTPAPCRVKCPVGIDVCQVMSLVGRNKFRQASNLVRSANLLYGITSLVCPQSEQCEAGCLVGKNAPPISIGNVMRYLYEWEQKNGGPQIPLLRPLEKKTVAVVGSGPAGLTAAAFLRTQGYEVFIFEAFNVAGGVLMYGIPEFRLPKSLVKNEVDYVLSFGGIELVTNCFIGSTISIQELRRDFGAVFFATGAGQPLTLGIPGEDLAQVMTANEYLTRINLMHGYEFPKYDTPVHRAKKVLVFGGGNVAMDAARCAIRMGADTSLMYRRSRKEMPARTQEIDHALEEGLHLSPLVSPLRVVGDRDGNVEGVECIKNSLGEPDASGRAKQTPIKGSEYIEPCDLVIAAIGQVPSTVVKRGLPEILMGKGNIRMDESRRTSELGCFTGGDSARGGATVILAMEDGKKAASAITAYLRGDGSWPTAQEFTPIT